MVFNTGAFTLPQDAEIPKGAYGVWQIPSINVSVPVYKPTYKDIQKVLDDEDSAAMVKWGCGWDIGDHINSKDGKGRWLLQNVHVDDAAFLLTPDGTISKYTCTAVLRVKVMALSAYLYDGTWIYPKRATDICCTCCVPEGPKENYMAVFKLTSTMPKGSVKV